MTIQRQKKNGTVVAFVYEVSGNENTVELYSKEDEDEDVSGETLLGYVYDQKAFD